jgi:hypothetical protein
MNELASLGSLGLALPSPAYIVGSVLFGIVGYVAYRRGRKVARSELTWAGVVMMVYPYAVSQTWLLWVAGVVLCGWLYAKWD